MKRIKRIKPIFFAFVVSSALYFSLLGAVPAEAKTFHHPSVITSQLQLEKLANNKNNNKKYRAALDQLLNSQYASLDRPHIPFDIVRVEASTGNKYEKAFRGDAHAARALALRWVVSGESQYSEKAKEILNAWSKGFKKLEAVNGKKEQVNLEAAWALPIWIGAADIVRYYNDGAANWKDVDVKRFDNFISKLSHYAKHAYRPNNWGASSVLSLLSVAVYMEDEEAYLNALKLFEDNLKAVSTSEGALKADYLRDPWHPQYTITAWLQSAEIAWHNGDDLYGINFGGTCPRLLQVLEHFSKLFSGEISSPRGLKKGQYKNSHLERSGYQIGYNHYANRVRYDNCTKNLRDMIKKWYPGALSEHFMSWDAITHYAPMTFEN